MLLTRLFLPFAAAYFLSYHFRTANAVVGPVLSGELALGAADLGLLTSTYFLAFGAAQLPLGVLLDRFGARRVDAALLVIAAIGAAIFASADDIATLAIGRALIGFGVSACLMASFKAFSQWFPPERQASLTGWIMTFGTLGALAASTPLNAALQVSSWRVVFVVLALATLASAVWIFLAVPEKLSEKRAESMSEQMAGFKTVVSTRHFWRYSPLACIQLGGFMAVQGLWSTGWLIHVNGFSRALAADHLAAMSAAMIVAYALIGLLATRLARRGVSVDALLASGLGLALVSLLLIASQRLEQHYLLWMAYGSFSSFGTLVYAQHSAGYPVTLVGRANAALNLTVFVGAFALQWGIGGLIDVLQARGVAAPSAYPQAFAVLIALQAAAYLWMIRGNRRAATAPDG